MPQSYLAQIDKYYRSRQIHSLDFGGDHVDCCCKAAHEKGKTLFGPKASFIGSKYGNGGHPRLVFLSLDPGRMDYCPLPIDRTPEAVQTMHEEDGVSSTADRHWYGTHLLALQLLSEFDSVLEDLRLTLPTPIRAPGNAVAKLRLVTPYFAHVNSAKCCVNESGSMEPSPHAFAENCWQFTPGELDILKPDVILTQCSPAAKHIGRFAITRPDNYPTATSNPLVQFCEINNRIVLWIKTTHPAAPSGRFWTEGGVDWCDYVNAVKNLRL